MISASFERDDYVPGDFVVLRVLVENVGARDADGVVVRVRGNVGDGLCCLGGFSEWGGGATARVGLPDEYNLTFYLPGVVRPAVEFEVVVPGGDANPADNRLVVAVPAPGIDASLSGVLYGDRDLDGVVDPGETLSGVEVNLFYTGMGVGQRVVRTDSQGRFSLPELVIGSYSYYVGLSPGWKLDSYPEQASVDLRAGANELVLRAVRVVKPTLTASVRFDRDSYAVGDVVREFVSLTNTGSADLVGITALCSGPGNPGEMYNPQWGDLAYYTGAGVTVRAGETRQFEFTDVVQPDGFEAGYVYLSCYFANDGDYLNGTLAGDEADVPGGRGGFAGAFYDASDGNMDDERGLAGLKFYLVGRGGRIAVRGVTDAAGQFSLTGVPAGRYEVRVVGPWRFVDHIVTYVNVYNGRTMDRNQFSMAPGGMQPDPDAPPADDPPAAPGTPVPQGAVVPDRLADTGASVGSLLWAGVVLVLVGVWLVSLPVSSCSRKTRSPSSRLGGAPVIDE